MPKISAPAIAPRHFHRLRFTVVGDQQRPGPLVPLRGYLCLFAVLVHRAHLCHRLRQAHPGERPDIVRGLQAQAHSRIRQVCPLHPGGGAHDPEGLPLDLREVEEDGVPVRPNLLPVDDPVIILQHVGIQPLERLGRVAYALVHDGGDDVGPSVQGQVIAVLPVRAALFQPLPHQLPVGPGEVPVQAQPCGQHVPDHDPALAHGIFAVLRAAFHPRHLEQMLRRIPIARLPPPGGNPVEGVAAVPDVEQGPPCPHPGDQGRVHVRRLRLDVLIAQDQEATVVQIAREPPHIVQLHRLYGQAVFHAS